MKELKAKINSSFILFSLLTSPFSLLSTSLAITAEIDPAKLHLQVIVNSNQDGAIAPDSALTLREAVEIVNGTLPLNKLSAAETDQVKLLDFNTPSRIEFNLPVGQTTIQLTDILPPLVTPGLIIDGTTQPGYTTQSDLKNKLLLQIPPPVVAITPAPSAEIFRGFTIAADGVTIKGLSLYGFTAQPSATVSTPPADIFIADQVTALETSQQQNLQQSLPLAQNNIPPQNVVITDNWLGVPVNRADTSIRSAFGVSVFNSLGTTIQRNRIANHDGSGVITGKQAANLRITNNIIERNGFAGMPDAIRLEGAIQNSQIAFNLIRENAGSAVYTFKPEGSVQIRNNNITNNGKRFQRAAIYLMGNDHTVINNKIINQSGSGVVVAAYPRSRRNRIQDNEFSNLSGLTIDLVTQQNVSPQDYQQGDGSNPPTDSYQRRRKTGNFGIDAPRWLSPEFILLNPKAEVTLVGFAEPGSQVEIYRSTQEAGTQQLLGKPIGTVEVKDQKGRFSVTLGNLKVGDRVSAIATHRRYGTSEPAVNTVIKSIGNAE